MAENEMERFTFILTAHFGAGDAEFARLAGQDAANEVVPFFGEDAEMNVYVMPDPHGDVFRGLDDAVIR